MGASRNPRSLHRRWLLTAVSAVAPVACAGVLVCLIAPRQVSGAPDPAPDASVRSRHGLATPAETTIRVATSGSDSPGCGGVGSPCRTVQYAVDQAQEGDEIRVAAGTYADVHARGGFTQVVYVDKTLTLRGGYSTLNWDTPDPVANLTILDAQRMGRVVTIIGTPSTGRSASDQPDEQPRGRQSSAQDVAPLLEGLRITGGDATGGSKQPWEPDPGGGVYARYASPTISACMIYSNTASTMARGDGGGIHLWFSAATLQNNVIFSNTASTVDEGTGGGLSLRMSDALVRNNTLESNTGSTGGPAKGGGIYAEYSAATIEGNTLRRNTASTGSSGAGGGLYLRDSAGAFLSDNAVVSNTASTGGVGKGGAVYLHFSPATLEGNDIVSNTAGQAHPGDGGGLYLWYSGAVLRGNAIEQNTAASGGDGRGGGLYLYESDATLRENTVRGNRANTGSEGYGYGGGLFASFSEALVQDNAITHNAASTGGGAGGTGGGIYLTECGATLAGNTVADNAATTGAGAHGSGGGVHIYGGASALEGNTVEHNTASIASSGLGGGILLTGGSPVLEHNRVIGNVAGGGDWGDGGGLCLHESPAILEGNVIVSNTDALTGTVPARGSGLFAFRSDVRLSNNVIAANHANAGGGGLFLAGFPGSPSNGYLLHTTIAGNTGGPGVHLTSDATVAFTNTIIADHADVGISVSTGGLAQLEATLWHGNGTDSTGDGTILTGTVNVYGDPAFVDPASWDYHLGPGSAAADNGVDAGVTTDIDGDARPHGTGFDIGADETNLPPVADAGPDQSVDTLTLVALDGSGSSDPDDDYPLSYLWTQTGGATVTLSGPSHITSAFTAPVDPSVLTFALAVTDSLGLPGATPDTVVITVTNQAPAADAGPDQTVDTLTPVSLDGSGSSDPDGDTPLAYVWQQTGGPLVALGNPAAVGPTFTAPDDPAVLTFSLSVTDSLGLSDATPDHVTITVTNQAPLAHAGPDQDVQTLALVTLDGTGSADPDGDYPLSYGWTQTDGPPVALSDATAVTPTFTAPDGPAVLVFSLAVTDSLGLSDPTPDLVIVTVTNQPPLADAGADQTVDTLSLVTLDGSASSDPDRDLPLTFRWRQVGGTGVSLRDQEAVTPTFAAPHDPTVLAFSLMVTDTLGLAAGTPDEVLITVTNQAPVAHAGPDQNVDRLAVVTLDGTGSSDPDGDTPLTYGWTQTGGPGVGLSDRTVVAPIFTAPGVPTVLTFTLSVTDSLGLPATAPSAVVIAVRNQPPVAEAGSDQIVGAGTVVTLDGSGSLDPDGDLPLSYTWAQTGGPTVTLDSRTTEAATFTAPDQACLLTFTLVVTDSLGLPAAVPDQVTVAVRHRLYLPLAVRDHAQTGAARRSEARLHREPQRSARRCTEECPLPASVPSPWSLWTTSSAPPGVQVRP